MSGRLKKKELCPIHFNDLYPFFLCCCLYFCLLSFEMKWVDVTKEQETLTEKMESCPSSCILLPHPV